ncbi:hypothetical protein C6P46_005380 [Rhodotorula mucilaginosa]|uniref:Gti1/Pac2 family-domain-containing protein n=1 Tax=Rhodotorula mucilaginosa TaxID=5537 RepID=A0A9P7B5D6_RHOMI|nr:hypothetical protein C6P46_005380 [Rhodotorula mucilaginosa]
MTRAGHSYFGVVSSAQEAHAILEASKLGLLPRVTRRLTDEERTRFVRAGAVFVWEEEEAGIRRWTDHIKWSPSRVSGAFLTYTEVPNRGEDSLIKQSFSAADANGSKMHLIAYTSKAAFAEGSLPFASRDPLVQHMLAQRTRTGHDPRTQPLASSETLSSGQPSSGGRSPTQSSSSSSQHGLFDSSRSHSNSSSTQASSILPVAVGGAELVRSISETSEQQRGRSSVAREPTNLATQPQPPPPIAARREKAHFPTILRPTESGTGSGSERTYRYDPVRDGPSSAPPTATEFPPTTPLDTSFPHRQASSDTSMHSLSPYAEFPPTTRASPYDANPRQLPPLEVPAASGIPIPIAESPSWTFDTLFSTAQDADAHRQSPRIESRGSEDERQLRLLGNGF